MPDKYGFDVLPDWGRVTHRCIECGWPGPNIIVREKDRERHHRTHVRTTQKEIETKRLDALRSARRIQRLSRKESQTTDTGG
jgi:hypothetical protein